MQSNICLEYIFFTKYTKELSAEAWRTLLKFRVLSKKLDKPEAHFTKESFYKFVNIFKKIFPVALHPFGVLKYIRKNFQFFKTNKFFLAHGRQRY